jgi:hypothetical protein
MITGLYLLHYGHSYDLLDASAKAIEIGESDKLVVRVISSSHVTPRVDIGDFTLSLNQLPPIGNGFIFESKEAELFRNFIGVSHIEVSALNDENYINSTPINVLARKITCEKAVSFLRYIVSNEDVSSACFSVTHGKSDVSKRTESIMSKINLGMIVLSHLKNEWARFEKDSCTKKEFQQSLERYDRRMHLDDQSISYLSSHPDELTLSSQDQADIRLTGRLYSIGNIVVNKGILNKNVYENQVILSFLYTFMAFLKSVKKKNYEVKQSNKSETVSIDGGTFISIDRLLKDSGLIFDYSKVKVDAGVELCQKYIRVLQERFGCQISLNAVYKPVPTHKVLLKPHYLNAFKLIRNYHAAGEPEWKGMSDSYGLRSLPKIYEFVVLIGLINSLIRLGYNREKSAYLSSMSDDNFSRKPINEINNYHAFSNSDGTKVKLFYDLSMRSLAELTENDMNGTPVDIKGYSASYTWRPDYYLLVEKGDTYAAHILDAKYSTMENVTKFLLPQCAMKYGLQARVLTITGGKMVNLKMADSVTVACSEYAAEYKSITQRSVNKLRDEIKAFCPIKPEIGYIGVDENAESLLMNLIDKFL